MMTFVKNPLRSVFSALKKSVPQNWFLRGDDKPYSGTRTAISDPYAQSTWVFAAINLIAQPLKSAKVMMRDAGTGEAISDSTLSAFWAAPARGARETMDLAALIENTVAIRGVEGGAFWLLDDSWMMASQKLRNPIILAAPSQMMPVWDGRTLAGWGYRDGSGTMRTFAVAQVIHMRMPNPGDPDSLDGIPPCTPSKESAEAARAGSKFARRVMDQNGDRGNFLIAKHALTQPQIDLLRAELAEKRRAADEGLYRDSVIGGDVEIVPNAVSAVTSGFVGQVAMSRDEIFVAYGVPPSMATVAASYSVGAASDWYRLITGTCSAEGMVIAKTIARVSEYVLGWRSLEAEVAGRDGYSRSGATRRVVAEFDFSGHPVMAEVRAARVGELSTLFKMGMSIETGNQWLGLGIPDYPGIAERWMPSGMLPVEMVTTPPPVVPPTTDGGKVLDDAASLVRQWSVSRQRTVKATQASVRLERWKRVDATREGDRKRVQKLVTRHLMTARAETLRNLKEQYGAKTLTSEYQIRAGVIEMVFDVSRWFGGLWTDLSRVLGGIYVTAGDQAAGEIEDMDGVGDFDPLTEADPKVVAQLNLRKNLIKGASDEMHADLIASLEEGIEAGETLDQLTARVRDVFKGFDKTRALTIARTETGAAYETARYLTFKAGGITQKGWLSGGDDGVTRDTHMAADGQRRGIDELFEVGEARLLHPHDQVNGEKYPHELINCRCVLTAEG